MKLTIGCLCKGGESYANKTGSWRTFTPVIAEDKCVGCGICETFCPEACIDMEENMPIIDLDYCKGCGICEVECPSEAIKMVEEGGEE